MEDFAHLEPVLGALQAKRFAPCQPNKRATWEVRLPRFEASEERSWAERAQQQTQFITKLEESTSSSHPSR